MNKKVIITDYNNKIITLLLENNKEQRIEIYNDLNENTLDSICVGRVCDVVPNIGAAFIEFKKNTTGFFSLMDNPSPVFLNPKNTKKICQGDLVLVQVKKEPIKSKTYLLSSKITLSDKYLVLDCEQPNHIGISKKISNKQRAEAIKSLLLPFVNDAYGFIVRTEAVDLSDEELLEQMNLVTAKFHDIVKKAAFRVAGSVLYRPSLPVEKDIMSFKLDDNDEIITDLPEIMDIIPAARFYDDILPLKKVYDIQKRITGALSKKVWLKTGGYLIIEPTEALTVIDVNTGKYDKNEKKREQTFLKINLEACKEIARQLVLRNLSGIIIVDFINMTDENNISCLIGEMKKHLEADYVKANFVDFTKLGLMEITRKKLRKPIHEILYSKEADSYENTHKD